jgi:carbon storage regulator
MLVLSRKRGESVVIRCKDGTQMKVTLVELRGDRVRLGFQAPSEVAIHREEIYAEIEKAKGQKGGGIASDK